MNVHVDKYNHLNWYCKKTFMVDDSAFDTSVNIGIMAILLFHMAKNFGASNLFALSSIFALPICLPILAFGKYEYLGEAKLKSKFKTI